MEYQFEAIGPALRIIVLIFLLVFVVLALTVIVVMAALPGRIATSRNHPQADAIKICGWVGLPTGVLWPIALIWAFTRSNTSVRSTSSDGSEPTLQVLRQQVDSLELAISALEACSGKGAI